jgi:hypothetical protein
VAVNVPTPAINAAMKVRTKNNRIPRTSIVMTLGFCAILFGGDCPRVLSCS